MLYLVVYDIADPRRLRRVARLCEDYGERIQWSVFACRLDPLRLDRLWTEMEGIIHAKEDRVFCYPVDAASERKALSLGRDTLPEYRSFQIF